MGKARIDVFYTHRGWTTTRKKIWVVLSSIGHNVGYQEAEAAALKFWASKAASGI